MVRRPDVLAVVVASFAAGPALAEGERTCTLGATIRSVEVRYAGDEGRPPCEVVYTKETEAPGREEVLWSATRDAGFCESKADELTRLLEENGWQCTPEREGGFAAAEALPAETPPTVAPAAGPEAPLPPPARPDSALASEGAESAAGGDEDDTSLAAAGPADRPVQDLEQLEDDEGQDNGVGGIFIPAEALEAAVERDLARLKKSADDAVEATVGPFGDLNDDRVDDAAVLITFDADGNDHAQYLVAYVAEGGTFRPAASRFIGGRYRKVFGGDVTTIRDGRIELELQVLEPEDPFCCPSGSESAEFVLENGELVSAP